MDTKTTSTWFAAIAQYWAAFCQTAPPNRLTIPNRPPAQQHIDNINAQLSEIENIIDYNREQMEHAETCLNDVITNQFPTIQVSQKEQDWLQLRIASIQFAISNHKGLSHQRLDETLIKRILEYGDPTMMAELTHYHNRAAVRHLNLMDMEATLSTLSPWLDMEESQKEYLPEKYA